jgi:hypothetical protein
LFNDNLLVEKQLCAAKLAHRKIIQPLFDPVFCHTLSKTLKKWPVTKDWYKIRLDLPPGFFGRDADFHVGKFISSITSSKIKN